MRRLDVFYVLETQAGYIQNIKYYNIFIGILDSRLYSLIAYTRSSIQAISDLSYNFQANDLIVYRKQDDLDFADNALFKYALVNRNSLKRT